MVFAVCRLALRDPIEAEDAMQQTFVSAYRSILAGSEPSRPAPWLAAIAHNECLDRMRARKREPLAEVASDRAAAAQDALNATIAREDLETLARSIRELPAQQRRALLLHEFHGLSYGEVAATIGVSESAIGSLLFRARTRLRSALHRAYASLPLPALWDAVDHLLARTPATTSAVPVVAKIGAAAVAVGLTASAAVVVDHGVQSHDRAPSSPPPRAASPATSPPSAAHPRRAAVPTYPPSTSRPAVVPTSTRTHRHAASPARTSHRARSARPATAKDRESNPSASPVVVSHPHRSGSPPQTHGQSSRAPTQEHSAHSPPAGAKRKGKPKRSHGQPSGKTQSHAAPKTADRSSRAHGNGTPHQNTGASSEPKQHGNGAEGNGRADHGNSHAHQGQ